MDKAIKQGLILFSICLAAVICGVLVGDTITSSTAWSNAKASVIGKLEKVAA